MDGQSLSLTNSLADLVRLSFLRFVRSLARSFVPLFVRSDVSAALKTYNPLLVNLVLANTLIVLCLPARLIGSAASEDIFLMLAAPLLWSTLLHFMA